MKISRTVRLSILSLIFLVVHIDFVWSQAPSISYGSARVLLRNAAVSPAISPTNSGGAIPAHTYRSVSLFAGASNGSAGDVDGTGTGAKFDKPQGLTIDASGNLYIADTYNHKIKKITPAGVVTTLAGDGYEFAFFGRLKNDNGTAASFNYPTDIAIHPDGSCLYVADKESEVIRRISLTSPFAVTTFAGTANDAAFLDHATTGTSAKFDKPEGIHYDNSGATHYLYVADRGNHRIRRITLTTTSGATATAGQVSTVAGSGTAGSTEGAAATARFNNPVQVAVSADGATIYVADFSNHKIRQISGGTVSTLAGSGTAGGVDATGASATFNQPRGIEIDGEGNLLVGEANGNRMRKVTTAGVVTTVGGTGTAGTTNGVGTAAAFDAPFGMVFEKDNALLYICDYGNSGIRKMEMGGYVLGTTLPTGLSMALTTGLISGTPTTRTASAAYTITGYNYYGASSTTLTLTIADLAVLTTTSPSSITQNAASSGGAISSDGGDAVTARGVVWSTSANPTVSLSTKTTDGSGTGSFTSNITGLTSGVTYYLRAFATNGAGTAYGTSTSFTTLELAPSIAYASPTHTFQQNTAITPVVLTNTGGTPAALQTSRLAGSQPAGNMDGTGTQAKFMLNWGMAFDPDGNIILADDQRIRKVTPAGVVTTIAGTGTAGFADGPAASAQFSEPKGVAVDPDGNIYVADNSNRRIRKIDLSGNVTTLAGSGGYGFDDGTGSLAKFGLPWGITYASDGKLYVADMGGRIRTVTLEGNVTTLAGSANLGFVDGIGTAARFQSPVAIVSDGLGNLYVTDISNHSVRKIVISSRVVTTLAGAGTVGSANGAGSAASFRTPVGITFTSGGYLLVSDEGNHAIRKVTTDGVVTTILGTAGLYGSTEGTGTSASFIFPAAVLEDIQGTMYVSDRGNRYIRKVSRYRISPDLPAGLSIDHYTGTISGTPEVMMAPRSYTVYATNSGGTSSATLTLSVSGAPTVETGSVSGVTSTGTVMYGTVNPTGGSTTSIIFKYSTSQATVDGGGGIEMVNPNSYSGFTVSSVNAAPTGLSPSTTYYYKLHATTAAGTSSGTTKSFKTSMAAPSISYSPNTRVLTAGVSIAPWTPTNTGGAPEPMQVTTFAGSASAIGSVNGTGTAARFNMPVGIVMDTDGTMYIADQGSNMIRKITSAGVVTTLAGNGFTGTTDGVGAAARFYYPTGVALDGLGNLYVTDMWNHLIRRVVLSSGQVTTIAGSTQGFSNGIGTSAQFKFPMAIVVGQDGNLYVTEANESIRKTDLTTMTVSTLAGGSQGFFDGAGASAKFSSPYGLARYGSSHLVVGSGYNNRVRKVQLSDGFVSTVAGGASAAETDGPATDARFNFPAGVVSDALGNIYVADQNNNRIRKISSEGNVTTLAGDSKGYSDGAGTSAMFSSPTGIAMDAQGNLWVTDRGNYSIRRLSAYSISPALPAGLSFNTATGEITGTPAAISATRNYTISAANAGGTTSTMITIEVSSTLTTTDASGIGSTSATSGGTVDATAYNGATQKGVCWNTTGTPTIADSKTQDGSGTGTFTSSLTGLSANTTYYLRSYVTVGGVTSYGAEKTFQTNLAMSIAPVTKTYGDAAFIFAAPVSNSTGAWSFASGTTSVATISGNTVTIAGAGSSVITATQAAAGAYDATSINFTLTVNKAIPTITLNVPTTTTLAAAVNMPITATASNSEPVTIAIGSGTATGSLSFVSSGSYTLGSVSSTGNLVFNASTAATANFAAASKTVTMNVEKNNQTITFNALTPVSYTTGMTQMLTATASSSESVSFTVVSGPGSVAGSTLTITGSGSILIRASQAGNTSFNPAPEVERTLTVNPSAPIITSFTPTSATEGDVVTITGQYFENVSAVSFGGTAATSFTVMDANTITAVMGTGHTGVVSVTTTGGTDTEPGFRYKALWTGATNVFNSTGNWSGGRIPQTDDDIIFSPTAASDLELDGHKTVGHVNFNGSGRSLKLGTYNLTVKGNLTMPGNFTGTGRVIMNGASTQTISGGGDIPDLEINNANGVSIDAAGGELTVSGTLRSTAGTLTTNGKLRLLSNSSNTARVSQVTGAITGDVIAERYVKRNENSEGTGRAWRLVSVPVTGTGTLRDFFMNGKPGQDLTLSSSRDGESDNSGTPIVGHNYATAAEATTAGFDWLGVANSVSSLRYYVGSAGGGSFTSENVPSLNTTYAAADQGYMVFTRGDRKLEFPSTTSSGPTTFRSTGSLKTGTQTVSVAPESTSKFTLVGNPYMSLLDLDAFYTTNSAVINPSFWIWEANMAGTNNQGGYINVYKSGSQWVTNTGSYIDPQLIESGMAFFVEPLSSLSTTTNINIAEAHKSTASAAGLSPFATDDADDHGRMYVRLERADDKGQRQLIDGVMADFHASFKTTLGDLSDREKLRNGISRGALWLKTENKLLSSEGLPWPKTEKRSIPLYMSGVGDQTLIVRINPRGMRDRYVQAWLKDNVLKRLVDINMNAPTDYDFIGTGSASWDSTRFEIVYVEAGRPSTGVTLEPDDAAEAPSVKLYPNPSKSADVKLSLRAMTPGTYSVHILDMTGRLVATTGINHRSLNGEYRILEGRRMAPGTYIIRLSDQAKQPKETLRLIVE